MYPKTKNQKVTHSPLPWKYKAEEDECFSDVPLIISNNDKAVSAINYLIGEKEGMKNLEFTLRACNTHYQLLKACKRALRELKPTLNDPPAKKRLCLQLGKAIHQAEKVIK